MRRSLVIMFVLARCVSLLAAQQPRILAPHRPIRQRLDKPFPFEKSILGSVVGGPWMIDANFKSTLYLRNVVETSPVTVTPIMFLGNGAEYRLSDVTLEAGGTAVVDLNEGLRGHGIAPWATLSGYVEVQYSWPWDPICATIHNVDTVHSLIFSYTLQSSKPFHPSNPDSERSSPDPAKTVVEGLWWKQESNVTSFVSLANTSSHSTPVQIQVSDRRMSLLATHTLVISPHGTKTISLDELQTVPDSAGGIQITYDGASNDVLINGGLQDQASGYSAIIPFTHDLPEDGKTSQVTVAELGLMVGAADPMMSFPPATKFTPYSVLRNISNAPAVLTPTLWWMQGSAAHSTQLTTLSVSPHSSQSLDVMAMVSTAGLQNFNGSINLVFDVKGPAGGLLMASGSVDQGNTYVFEVTPRGVVESASKTLSYWSTENGDDTMVNLWNPADEPQDLVFRLSFIGGHYDFPIHLEPRASRAFNISEVIENQIPDSEGNVIPASVHNGAATIAGSNADNEHILVAMDAGTYNVRKATCGLYCQSCNGVTGYSISANPFSVAVNGQRQQTFYQTWNTGAQINGTSSGTWTTSNSSIVTVQTGLVRGVAHGKPTITAHDNFSEPVYTYQWCEGSQWSCPYSYQAGGGASSPGNVFKVTNEAPFPIVVGSSGPMNIAGTGFSGQTGPVTVHFSGTGITVTNPVVDSDSSISAAYSAASSTPAGSQNLTVTFAGADGGAGASSNPFPVTITTAPPVPKSASIDSQPRQAYSNQTWRSCDLNQSQNNAYGYQRCVTYQVNDQNGHPIYQNFVIQEVVSVVDANISSRMNSSNSVSNPTGQFLDQLALIGAAALPSGSCQIVKQSITASGNSSAIRVNCIKYTSTDVTITDVTTTPNSCSKPTYKCP